MAEKTISRRRGKGGRVMPPDILRLITTGVLRPEDQEQPAMGCARCGAPTTLLWKHLPMTAEQIASAKVLPGTAWGTDVLVICPTCSIPARAERSPS